MPRAFIVISAPVRGLARFVRRRAKTSVVAGACCLTLAAGVAYFWVHHHLWAAQRALQLDLVSEARGRIELYLRIQPDNVSARLLAARIDRLLGAFPDAEKQLDECKRLEGMSERIQMEWLFIRAQSEELLSVEPGILHTLANTADGPERLLILEGLAFAYVKELRFTAALDCLNTWLNAEPASIRAHNLRGWVRENLDNSDGAREDYERVLELCPQHMTARLRLVQVLLTGKNVAEAAAHMAVLQRDRADNPEVIFTLGCLRTLQGSDAEARASFERLLVLEPNGARALYRLGQLEVEPAAKEKWFRKALEIDPSYPEARYGLYASLVEQPKRGSDARAEKKRYQETLENWKTLKVYLAVLEKTPRNPDLLAKIGILLLDRDPGSAAAFLRRALQLAPNHRDATAALTRCEKAFGHRQTLSRSHTSP